MKKIILLIFLLVCKQAIASVTISEVLYNPLNSENDGEAVLLYNNGNKSIDISGWNIATKSSQTDASFPSNTFISSGGYLLIADKDFSLNKFNSSWPDPNYEEDISLSNTNGGLALINNSEIIDSVGWGDSGELKEYLFQGQPHTGVKEGQSLVRISNTENNFDDFISAEPFSRILNQYSLEQEIEVEIELSNDNIKINSISIKDENETLEGIQIKPKAGEERRIEIIVEVESKNGFLGLNGTIEFRNQTISLEMVNNNSTNAILKGLILMNYFDKPGLYTLDVKIESDSGLAINNTSFEYLSLSAIRVDNKINYKLNAGDKISKEVKVKNLGNKELILKVKGGTITNGEKIIENKNFALKSGTIEKNLEKQFQELDSINPGEEKNIEIELSTNNKMSGGKYKGKIVILAE